MMANGVHGVDGVHAAKHVAKESKEEQEHVQIHLQAQEEENAAEKDFRTMSASLGSVIMKKRPLLML